MSKHYRVRADLVFKIRRDAAPCVLSPLRVGFVTQSAGTTTQSKFRGMR